MCDLLGSQFLFYLVCNGLGIHKHNILQESRFSLVTFYVSYSWQQLLEGLGFGKDI